MPRLITLKQWDTIKASILGLLKKEGPMPAKHILRTLNARKLGLTESELEECLEQLVEYDYLVAEGCLYSLKWDGSGT